MENHTDINQGGTMKRGEIRAVPITREEAYQFIDEHHRHHAAAQGDKFRIGASIDDKIVGVAQCGRPVSRMLDDGRTLEVIRLCTTGEKNICSFLYSRCARIAKELGYQKIITYILESESGASLKASGWSLDESNVGGNDWNRKTRERSIEPLQMSFFPQKNKYPTEKKQRWVKILTDRGGNE